MSPTFSELTTLGVGGPIGRYVPLESKKQAVTEFRRVLDEGEDWLILGGGSNFVVGDDGFSGTVLHALFRGRQEKRGKEPETVLLTALAGEPWDELVEYAVGQGLAGLESLSGIPGSVGASVMQNIGAYGHDVSEVIDQVEYLDATTGEVVLLTPEDLGLGLRTSVFKQGIKRGLILSVTVRLRKSLDSLPIQYHQLADAVGCGLGDVRPLAEVRDAVLRIRRAKGMVVDPEDTDSRSVGSFFLNPIVSERFSHSLPAECPRWYLDEPADLVVALEGDQAPAFSPSPVDSVSRVKLSAAWLIEHAGISKGFSLPGSPARVSTKHTLAITNPHGGATAEDIASLARYIQTTVRNVFGVVLQPEPVLIGLDLG